MYNYFFNTFWVASGLSLWLDLNYMGWRVNGDRLNHSVILKDYRDMAPLVLFNLFSGVQGFKELEPHLFGVHYIENTWPVWLNVALWLATTDFLFYTIHKTFHNKYLYFIHSVHHHYKYTYGVGAIYAHPVEFYTANLFPAVAPMVLYGIPMWLCHYIICFATFYTIVVSHGGFKMKLATGHLYHHLKYRCNYGLFKMDQLMGTKVRPIAEN
jgi:sterol desaturase/sphingolipid hydroxylase (fatty acid hydroxylase superfamily)